MLNIHPLTLGLYQTNCSIVHNEGSKRCIVIDPGYEANTILNRTAVLGLEIEAILLTHAHFDHVGAVRAIAADTENNANNEMHFFMFILLYFLFY